MAATAPPPAPGAPPRKLGADDFLYGALLGEGAFARVVHCRLRPALVRDGRPAPEFAAKIMEKRHIRKESKTAAVMSERNVLSRAAHPNIVRLCYTFQDAEYLYLILELARGRELLSLINACAAAVRAGGGGGGHGGGGGGDPLERLVPRAAAAPPAPPPGGGTLACSVPLARFYAAQLVNALEYLHCALAVVHRDVKPENVLLSERGHAKLTDFGSSKSEAPGAPPETRADAFVGTAEYVSPEVLRDEPVHAPGDLWALGCVLYQCLTGAPPFRGGSEYLTFQQILGYDGTLNALLAVEGGAGAADEAGGQPTGAPAPADGERQRELRRVRAITASLQPGALVGVGAVTLAPVDSEGRRVALTRPSAAGSSFCAWPHAAGGGGGDSRGSSRDYDVDGGDARSPGGGSGGGGRGGRDREVEMGGGDDSPAHPSSSPSARQDGGGFEPAAVKPRLLTPPRPLLLEPAALAALRRESRTGAGVPSPRQAWDGRGGGSSSGSSGSGGAGGGGGGGGGGVPLTVLRFPAGFPAVARDLILQLLHHDPARRLGVAAMGGAPSATATAPAASEAAAAVATLVEPPPAPLQPTVAAAGAAGSSTLPSTAGGAHPTPYSIGAPPPTPLSAPLPSPPAMAAVASPAASAAAPPQPAAATLPALLPAGGGSWCGPVRLDYARIRRHPFFDGVDWAAVSDPRSQAPVTPVCDPLPEPVPPEALLLAVGGGGGQEGGARETSPHRTLQQHPQPLAPVSLASSPSLHPLAATSSAAAALDGSSSSSSSSSSSQLWMLYEGGGHVPATSAASSARTPRLGGAFFGGGAGAGDVHAPPRESSRRADAPLQLVIPPPPPPPTEGAGGTSSSGSATASGSSSKGGPLHLHTLGSPADISVDGVGMPAPTSLSSPHGVASAACSTPLHHAALPAGAGVGPPVAPFAMGPRAPQLQQLHQSVTPGIVSTSAFTSRAAVGGGAGGGGSIGPFGFGGGGRMLFSPATSTAVPPPYSTGGTGAPPLASPLPSRMASTSASSQVTPVMTAQPGVTVAAGGGAGSPSARLLPSSASPSALLLAQECSMEPPELALGAPQPCSDAAKVVASSVSSASSSSTTRTTPPTHATTGSTPPSSRPPSAMFNPQLSAPSHAGAAALLAQPPLLQVPPTFPAKGTSYSFQKGDPLPPAVEDYMAATRPGGSSSGSHHMLPLAADGGGGQPSGGSATRPASQGGGGGYYQASHPSRPTSPLPEARIYSLLSATGAGDDAGATAGLAPLAAFVQDGYVPTSSATPTAWAGSSSSGGGGVMAAAGSSGLAAGGVTDGTAAGAATAAAAVVAASSSSSSASPHSPAAAPLVDARPPPPLLPTPLAIDPRSPPWWLPLLDSPHGELPVRAGVFQKRKALHVFTSGERELVLTRGGPRGPRLLYLNPSSRSVSSLIVLGDPELHVALRSEKGAPAPPSSAAGGTSADGAAGAAGVSSSSSASELPPPSAPLRGGAGGGGSPFTHNLTRWLRPVAASTSSPLAVLGSASRPLLVLGSTSRAGGSSASARGVRRGFPVAASAVAPQLLAQAAGGAPTAGGGGGGGGGATPPPALEGAGDAGLSARSASKYTRSRARGSLLLANPPPAGAAASATSGSRRNHGGGSRAESHHDTAPAVAYADAPHVPQPAPPTAASAPVSSAAVDGEEHSGEARVHASSPPPSASAQLPPLRFGHSSHRSLSFSGPLTPHKAPPPSSSREREELEETGSAAGSVALGAMADAATGVAGACGVGATGGVAAVSRTPRTRQRSGDAAARHHGSGLLGSDGELPQSSSSMSARSRRALSDGDETIPSIIAALASSAVDDAARGAPAAATTSGDAEEDAPCSTCLGAQPAADASGDGGPARAVRADGAAAAPEGAAVRSAPMSSLPAASPHVGGGRVSAVVSASHHHHHHHHNGAFPRERGILDIHAGPLTLSSAAAAPGTHGSSGGAHHHHHAHRVFFLLDSGGDALGWATAIMAAKSEALQLAARAAGAVAAEHAQQQGLRRGPRL